MTFSAIHRALGEGPCPWSDELLDRAVAHGVPETDDLDWKRSLPDGDLPRSDFPKDVAAMANSGGGMIVYGVGEENKAATERTDAGELTERRESAIRSVAISAISPPVFGLRISSLEGGGNRAILVEIPASVDVPHLVYRNEYFGAPIRSGSDTAWMKERQIEAMYRARFDERRHATEALDRLYSESIAGRDITNRAWMVAVAHPRTPCFRDRLSRDEARQILRESLTLCLKYAAGDGIHPLRSMNVSNPRPGLRRWVAADTAKLNGEAWRESQATIHDDGSVTVASAIGGRPTGNGNVANGWEIAPIDIGSFVADFMALIRSTSRATGNEEYELRTVIKWLGPPQMEFLSRTMHGIADHLSTPLRSFTPVEISVNASASDEDYRGYVNDLAADCVNQGGVFSAALRLFE